MPLTRNQLIDYTQKTIQNFHEEMIKLYGYSANITVGEYTYGMPIIKWWGEKTQLTIGNFCSIAKDVTIFLGGEHQPDFTSTYPFLWYPFEWDAVEKIDSVDLTPSKGDIIIGNDVWIGHGATILSGVTIGDGAVIGANALVTKDIPPYAIYGGNPAMLIRYRFDEETIKQLVSIAWWNWSKEKINEAIPALLSRSPENIFEFHKKYKSF